MSDASSYPQPFAQAFTPLAEEHRRIRAALKRVKDQGERELWRASQQALVASFAALISRYDVVQETLATIVEFYLEIQHALKVAGEPDKPILHAGQQTCSEMLRAALERQDIAQETVSTLVMIFQALEHERRAADQSQHTTIRALQGKIIDALWGQLKGMLVQMTSIRWVDSWTAANIFDNTKNYPSRYRKAETLALIGFSYICEQLLGLDLDPHNNVPGLLTLIAHRGITQQYNDHLGRKRSSAPKIQIESGMPEAAMWSDGPRGHVVGQNEDGKSWDDLERRVLEAVENKQCWETVQALMETKLSPQERIIIQRRWFDRPAVDFATIAVELGGSWNANNTCVAHHRILKKIRRHLRSLGIDSLE
jgi:hypothetical protein